jgi:cyanophycinase
MAPGLGLAKNKIIDQHFSERGRIRRLLGAVAENPRMLGANRQRIVEPEGS